MEVSAYARPAHDGKSDATRTPQAEPLARIVFALLVIGTFVALGITQYVKHTPTPVQQLEISPSSFNPSVLGTATVEHIAFRIDRSDHVSVTVIDTEGNTIRAIARRLWLRRYKRVTLSWDGRGDDGRYAPAGTYRLRFDLEHGEKHVVSPVSFELR